MLLYERREVALVFYALGDVNRTSGLCLGHTFLNSGFIIRVGLSTANLESLSLQALFMQLTILCNSDFGFIICRSLIYR